MQTPTTIGIYKNDILKQKPIVMNEKGESDYELTVGKKTKILLSTAVLQIVSDDDVREIEHKHLSFKIHFDKEYVFVCNSLFEMKYWIETLYNKTQFYGIIGLPLNLAIEKSGWRIPSFIYRSIECLRKNNALETVGLFRVTSGASEIKELENLIDEDEDIGNDFSDDCILVASFLKNCLKSMIEPLIPFDNAKEFVDIADNKNPKEFVDHLPEQSQDSLYYLLDFLMDLNKNNEVNKMPIPNIATCIALCISKDPSLDENQQMMFVMKSVAAFEFILQNFDTLFVDVKERNEKLGMTPPKSPAFSGVPHISFDIIYQSNKAYAKSNSLTKRLSASFSNLVHRKGDDPNSPKEKQKSNLVMKSSSASLLNQSAIRKAKASRSSFNLQGKDSSKSPSKETSKHSSKDTSRERENKENKEGKENESKISVIQSNTHRGGKQALGKSIHVHSITTSQNSTTNQNNCLIPPDEHNENNIPKRRNSIGVIFVKKTGKNE